MPAVVAETELFRACEILFGLELNLSREFLEYLQHAGVRSAYRKKARETHPDLAINKSEQEKKALAQVFLSVQEAYENLKAYLDARDRGYCITTRQNSQSRPQGGRPVRQRRYAAEQRTTAGGCQKKRHEFYTKRKVSSFGEDKNRRRPSCTGEETATYYQGPMPNRKLLFGHYLYYSGVINWQSIVQALVWQRTGRPRLGELGKKLGWLTERDIRRIMEHRTPFQPFGECAVKLGILTEQQRALLVFQQKRLQKKIGNYFVENRLISQQMLNRYLVRCRSHNANMQYGDVTSCSTC